MCFFSFSAFYCTYFIVDLLTNKVLSLWVATKEMVYNRYLKIYDRETMKPYFSGNLFGNDGASSCKRTYLKSSSCMFLFYRLLISLTFRSMNCNWTRLQQIGLVAWEQWWGDWFHSLHRSECFFQWNWFGPPRKLQETWTLLWRVALHKSKFEFYRKWQLMLFH